MPEMKKTPAKRPLPRLGMELTPRQKEILCWLTKGISDKEIARKIGCEYGTVKVHLRAVYIKLGVDSRLKAALIAKQWGMA